MREAKAARWFLSGVVVFALLGTVSTIVFATELTKFIVDPAKASVVVAILAAVIKALTLVGQEWFAAIAANRVKAQLRFKLLSEMRNASSEWRSSQNSAELNLLLTTGLDSLDAYFAKFLPQIVYTVIAAPIYVLIIFSKDALSGVIVLATMPLIPLFMTLIGWATAKVQTRQLASLTILSKHFADAMRGLTTLRVFGRARAQVQIMLANAEQHRKRTMKVLSVSFLSGFALELIASLAVALVAVSIGLRLIDGTITLAAGLLVLILAPDAYLPLRMIGANFHASADGVVAIERTFTLLDAKPSESKLQRTEILPISGKIVAVVGPSGSGKTSALRLLVSEQTSWMPQGATIFEGTVQSNIVGPTVVDHQALERAVALAALDDLNLSLEVSADYAQVSGGQAQRIALARVFYRALSLNCQTILLDEPSSALDNKRAETLNESLRLLANEGFAIVVVSHQAKLIKVADKVIEVAR